MAFSLSRVFPLHRTSTQIQRETGWGEVSNGLTLLLRGYLLLSAGLALGASLLWYADNHHLVWGPGHRVSTDEQMSWILFGFCTIILGPVLGCSFVSIGQWRCLGYAPERHGAKSLMFSCITCLFLAIVLTTAAVWASAADNARVLQRGWPGWDGLEFSLGTLVLQLASAGGWVLSIVLFTTFLRSVASCFRDDARVRWVDLYLVFTSFLVGGTLFLFLGNRTLASQSDFLLALGVCWVFYFTCHLLLVRDTRSCIRANQEKLASPLAK